MSDYKSMRMKKNADLEHALLNVKKDLYDWKQLKSLLPSSSTGKDATNAASTGKDATNAASTISQQRPVFPSPPAKIKTVDSTLRLKRTNSLKDLAKHVDKVRPFTGAPRLEKLDDLSDGSVYMHDNSSKNNEFLTSFGSNLKSPSPKPLPLKELTISFSNDRTYLNTYRGPLPSFRDASETEAQLIQRLNQKDTLNVFDMDLSQLKLNNMKNLQKFPNLKTLDYSCNKIKKIENLNFEFLVELKLYANEIELVENLENLPELQSLQLHSNKIKQLNKGLNTLKKLEYLRLDRNYLTSIKIAEIAPCSNLIYLDISHNQIDSLTFINSLPNLEELTAANIGIAGRLNELDPNRCRKLYEINLNDNKLTDSNLSPLINFSSLNILKLSNNQLESVKCLSNIKSLKYLDISNNQIEVLSDLSNLTDLETLNVSHNKVNDWFQITSLVRCADLMDLIVNDNPIMNSRKLLDVSIALPNLKYVDEISVEELKNKSTSVNNVARSNKKSADLESSLLIFDYEKFEQEIKANDEKISKKFNDIKESLDRLDDDQSNKLSVRYSRLVDALNFSKQIDDNDDEIE